MLALLRRWWKTEHDLPGPGALAIELVVVVVGVFAAQQLSNWNQRRVELKEVEGLHRDLFYAFTQYRSIAQTYEVALPCIEERVNLISRLASEGRPLDAKLLQAPLLTKMGPDDYSRESDNLLRERYGNKVGDWIGSTEFNLGLIQESAISLEKTWFELQRLNPSMGRVDSTDRDAARGAIVRIQSDLSVLERASGLILKLTDLLGIKTRAKRSLLPVASCSEMWRTGKGYVDVGVQE